MTDKTKITRNAFIDILADMHGYEIAEAKPVKSATLQDAFDLYLSKICARHKCNREYVLGKGREKERLSLRYMLIHIMLNNHPIGLNPLTRMLGYRDHTCVMNARDAVANKLRLKDEYFTTVYNSLKHLLIV